MNRRPNPRHLIVLILLIHSLLLVWGAAVHSPTVDEVAYLPAGISHWHYGRFELYRGNPPLVRLIASLPVVLARPLTDWSNFGDRVGSRRAWLVGRDFVKVNGKRSFWYFTIARWACIPFSLLGAFVCYRWARDLWGETSGLLAISLWCFSPNILGHGQLLTPDVGASAFGLAACYRFWLWTKSEQWHDSIFAGIVLGLAELTKMSWIILFILFPLLWGIRRVSSPSAKSGQQTVMAGCQLVSILVLGVFVLNVGYGFDGSFKRLGDYQFVSQALSEPSGNAASARPSIGNRFADTWLGTLPVPLPEQYISGIDIQKREFESGVLSYLRGEFKSGEGWWYYYLYGLAVKVPLGTWLLFGIALFSFAKFPQKGTRLFDVMILIIPAIVMFVFTSMQTGINVHFRYVLPTLPFLFVWVSQVAAGISRTRIAYTGLTIFAFSWLLVSSLFIAPHSLAYFNELAGGPTNGPAHLIDSNIDWGQDLIYLRSWLDEHPEARPFNLAYFGCFEPAAVGIDYQRLNSFTKEDRSSIQSTGPVPGWFGISVNYVRGFPYQNNDGNGHSQPAQRALGYFQKFSPVARAGYSINIYHLTLDDANRVRRNMGLKELSAEDISKLPANSVGADAANKNSFSEQRRTLR